MRAMRSPLRSSEKKPSESDVILQYIWLRMSRTTPVRMGMMAADDKKYESVLSMVMKANSRPTTSRVVVAPHSTIIR